MFPYILDVVEAQRSSLSGVFQRLGGESLVVAVQETTHNTSISMLALSTYIFNCKIKSLWHTPLLSYVFTSKPLIV